MKIHRYKETKSIVSHDPYLKPNNFQSNKNGISVHKIPADIWDVSYEVKEDNSYELEVISLIDVHAISLRKMAII